MEWLNYHHLYYFWVITEEGSLTRAAARLRLTHSTLSEQLRLLEQALGQQLFARHGRRLVLTEAGEETALYAADIFRLGHELMEVARGRASPARRTALRVGVVHAVPKTVVYRLLEPTEAAPEPPLLELHQGDLDSLLGLVSRHRLHAILSDRPPVDGRGFRVHSHKLGETGIVLYATARLAEQYREGFPRSLRGAPLLVPGKGSALRQGLDRWLADRGVEAQVVGELDDAGMLRTFGAFGRGLFPVRSVLVDEVEETYSVERVGVLEGLSETYYAITPERRVKNPYVRAIQEAARRKLIVSPVSR